MDELELLLNLIQLEKKSRYLQYKIDSNDPEKDALIQKNIEVASEINEYEVQLTNIPEKPFSTEAYATMTRQLEAYVEEIQKAQVGLSLDRDQGTIFKNELFAGIIRDINYLTTDRAYIIHRPSFLKFTRVPEGAIDVDQMIDFFNSELEALSQIDTPDYNKLRQFERDFGSRMIDRFISV
ncbi:MAG: hypothetical protein HRT71_20635 [Flavobacteriales bacterium]|nr:hypothetical protein [Flavobacteriales bacterium]